jgi:hypothetical protein
LAYYSISKSIGISSLPFYAFKKTSPEIVARDNATFPENLKKLQIMTRKNYPTIQDNN